jgi:hypothetical protein
MRVMTELAWHYLRSFEIRGRFAAGNTCAVRSFLLRRVPFLISFIVLGLRMLLILVFIW